MIHCSRMSPRPEAVFALLLSKMRSWLTGVPFIVLFLVHAAAHAETPIIGSASVVDGDTIEIHGQRIRFHGIDAPESRQECTRPDSTTWRCGQQGGCPGFCCNREVGVAHLETVRLGVSNPTKESNALKKITTSAAGGPGALVENAGRMWGPASSGSAALFTPRKELSADVFSFRRNQICRPLQ